MSDQTNAYPRVVIASVSPALIDSHYPARTTLGEPLLLGCVAFADDHELVSCTAYVRGESDSVFKPYPMRFLGNDRFEIAYEPQTLGRVYFYIEAEFLQNRPGLSRPKLPRPASLSSIHEVVVEPAIARFSSWYEFFPRSFGASKGAHGTFKDAERMLEHVAHMGFDVVYLPPIHPIGHTHRKGKNNALRAEAGDVGSPWAIGSSDGGHKAVHKALGTMGDFENFVKRAHAHGLEIALDLAFQCSPDHPYVKERPEWFRKNLDGTLAFAENPPKKYQDIHPFDFSNAEWPALYSELKSVVEFWIEKGVRIFRVDNPHTKPFHFWKWLIAEIRAKHPDVVFLSEAFTRPHISYHLAKIGFSLSYTYFTWRHNKEELTELMREYTNPPHNAYFRPHLWPNTPDILNRDLQGGSKANFIQRLALAATLSPAFGVYGPAFELMYNEPKEEGSEEYLHSEKYELKHHAIDSKQSLAPLIKRLNQIRKDNRALQFNHELQFLETHNPNMMAYIKRSKVCSNSILTVVNLDDKKAHSATLKLESGDGQLQELIGGTRLLLDDGCAHITLDPAHMPVGIFRVQAKLRSEHDFDYFG